MPLSAGTQLGREVALKILPGAFSADPDRLARFRREAQVWWARGQPKRNEDSVGVSGVG